MKQAKEAHLALRSVHTALALVGSALSSLVAGEKKANSGEKPPPPAKTSGAVHAMREANAGLNHVAVKLSRLTA